MFCFTIIILSVWGSVTVKFYIDYQGNLAIYTLSNVNNIEQLILIKYLYRFNRNSHLITFKFEEIKISKIFKCVKIFTPTFYIFNCRWLHKVLYIVILNVLWTHSALCIPHFFTFSTFIIYIMIFNTSFCLSIFFHVVTGHLHVGIVFTFIKEPKFYICEWCIKKGFFEVLDLCYVLPWDMFNIYTFTYEHFILTVNQNIYYVLFLGQFAVLGKWSLS